MIDHFSEEALFGPRPSTPEPVPPPPISEVKPVAEVPGLTVNLSKKIQPNLANAVAIIRHSHPDARTLKHDEFTGQISFRGRGLDESVALEITRWLQVSYHSKFTENTVHSALSALAYEQRFDSLIDAVSKPVWDGVRRIDAFCETYLGVEPSVYATAVGRTLWLSLAARALFPGCKQDLVVVLEGAQGVRKSTAAQIIGGAFFAELMAHQFGSRECAEQVCGVWVVEIGELQGLSKADTNEIKGFIARLNDRYRRPYARTVTENLRRCVLIGTTNATEYLRDETGARRWLPIRVPKPIDTDALARDREQLIAEAVFRVRKGEKWHLTGVDEIQAQAGETSDRYQVDEWERTLEKYLQLTNEITVAEALTKLGFEPSRMDRASQMRCSACLIRLGFERRNTVLPNGARKWAYVRRQA